MEFLAAVCACAKSVVVRRKKRRRKKVWINLCFAQIFQQVEGLKSNAQPDKGQPLLDKVQPDMDELDELTKKDEVKNLGKLQYSLDYDFQQNNVSKFDVLLEHQSQISNT